MDLGSDGWGSTRAGKRRRLPAGDQFRGGAAGEGAALLTPNSSVSLSSSDREGDGQPRRCKKKADDEVAAEGDEKDQEDGENSTKAYVFSLI